MDGFAHDWPTPTRTDNNALQMDLVAELHDGGFEPQTRARSNTWPCPRPENFVDPPDELESTKASNQHLAGDSQQTVPSVSAAKKNSSRRNAWGNLSYADLITHAIGSATEKRLTLSQIYEWMVHNVPYFKDKGDSNSSAGWKGPIKNKSYPNNFTSHNNSNVIPYASSSDEEDDVIVGQTLAEINTPSMRFEGEPPTPATSPSRSLLNENGNLLKSADRESSEEISEEDDFEEEELIRIKEIEEKYLQQILAKSARKADIQQTETLEKKKQDKIQEGSENLTESEAESEAEEEQEVDVDDDENLLTSKKLKNIDLLPNQKDICDDNVSNASTSSAAQCKLKDNTAESVDQTKLMQLIQKSLTNLQIASTNDNEVDHLKMCQDPLINENIAQTNSLSNMGSPEKIALAIVNALKSAGLKNLESKEKSRMLEKSQELTHEMNETEEDDEDGADDKNAEQPVNENENYKNETEVVPFQSNLEEEKKVEVEEIQNNNSYYEDRDFGSNDHFVYQITSRTPTSFNSDDHIFHANFIKQLHRTNSTDQMRAKPYPRKSMSFSNERMREIERHNQILLRKILTQKPTYIGKSKKPPQSSSLKTPTQTNTRLTNSAVNRKKQQRQINIDNQVLKRKIEAISLRRRPLIS